jgi:ribonuclease-3
VVGSLFLDSGWEAAREFVRRRFHDSLDALPQIDRNYKSLLQQLTQKHFKALPVYRVVREKGPPHSKTFNVEVHFRGQILGRGGGRSKKDAQQEAAREALERVAAMVEPVEPRDQ